MLLVLAGAVEASKETGAAPKGKGETTVRTTQGSLQVFTYKPARFSSGPILFVFHGQKRNAANYRDYAIPLAGKMQAMVAAPCFDADAFPVQSYSQGNLFDGKGRFQPRREWSLTTALEVIRAVLAREGNPERPYCLLGHSAGGQFVVRLAAMEKTGAQRLVAANPGTYAFPRADWDWPYGFGRLPAEMGGEKNLRRFLATPLTVLLGQADTNNSTEAGNFPATPEANRQGTNRLERGRNFFEAGRQVAHEKGWEFGWEKVEIPGVGHDGELMINDLATERILRLKNKAP
jgi:poly(3-hydroxybutyrate) depolymerase